MAIENHGISRLPARQVFPTGGDDEISLSGNAVVARLRQCDAPLADELVQSVRSHLDRVLHSPYPEGENAGRTTEEVYMEQYNGMSQPISKDHAELMQP